jgi:putative component of membrane protein insertase Oxa1/YidC/SpoIIIJ protein YidD
MPVTLTVYKHSIKALMTCISALIFWCMDTGRTEELLLAEQLYRENHWSAARTEALRLLVETPGHADARCVYERACARLAENKEKIAHQKLSLWARPAVWSVRLYQHQISPAIGQRCSMHPSCSAFCVEAVQRYGVVGVAMTGDRLVRETDHVRYRIKPVMVHGQEKYLDPVSDHSKWFKRYRREQE